MQTAVPSRENVVTYLDLKKRVEMLVSMAELYETQLSVHYLHRNLPVEELAALYVAADVMLVTPFRDGMNLVAKEYVASRTDETGTLVLSEFTGAAVELGSALLVNPHDVDGVSSALSRALRMPRAEAGRRMRRLRSVVKGHDVFDWGREFLEAVEQ